MPYRDSPAAPASSPPAAVPRPRSVYAVRNLYMLPIVPWVAVLIFALNAAANDRPIPFFWVALWTTALAGWFVWRRKVFKQGVRALLDAQALFTAGSTAAGRECCEQILDKYRGFGGIEASAICNLSIAAFREGDSARALAMLDAVENAGWCPPRSVLRPTVVQNRALYHAVLGNLPEAERATREARSLMTAARAAATMLTHDAVIAARAGRFADVVALTGTSDAVARLQLKLLRLLRAWALTNTGGSADDVRVLVDGARPVTAGELRYVTAHWPEFRTFLVAQGLGEAA
jgi:hypothetical protein